MPADSGTIDSRIQEAARLENGAELVIDCRGRKFHNPAVMRNLLRIGYLAIPLALLGHHFLPKCGSESLRHWEPLITFVVSGIGVIPVARLMGEATAQLAARAGPTVSGLLNATFGNAAELIIAIVALTRGLNDVVKASLIGSILGNLLLVSGGAMIIGGRRRERQFFSRAGAENGSALLAVAVTAMLFPAIFHFSYRLNDIHLAAHEAAVSVGTAIVLLAVYALGLVFTLKTHRHIFSPSPEDRAAVGQNGTWSAGRSVIALLVASILTAIVAELLVGSVETAAVSMRWNATFVAVILLAIFGNVAEQSGALILAARNDMDTAMSITYQSSLQIALFTTPFIVLLSQALAGAGVPGVRRLDLIFPPLEVAAVFLSVGIITVISRNGETNWFEGVLLVAVYAILGITFFYIPAGGGAGYDSRAGAALPQEAPHGVAR